MGGLAIIGVPAELAEDILELIVELHRLQSLQGCACSTMDCSDLVVSSFPSPKHFLPSLERVFTEVPQAHPAGSAVVCRRSGWNHD